jgi:hypothetical protein
LRGPPGNSNRNNRRGRRGIGGRRGCAVGVDYAAYSVFQDRDVEVDQEAYLAGGEFEVGHHLGEVDGAELRYRLELDYYLSLYEQVDPVGAVQLLVHENQGHGDLAFHFQALAGQVRVQAGLVRGFEEAGAQLAVDGNGTPNDAFGDGVEVCHSAVLSEAPNCVVPQSAKGGVGWEWREGTG